MKQKFTDGQLLAAIREGLSADKTAARFGCSTRVVMARKAALKAKLGVYEVAPKKTFNREVKQCRTYVITCAQNATEVHKAGLQSLLTFCKRNKAELIIQPIRYRNPTSLWTKHNEDDDWWDQSIVKYLSDSRFLLNENLAYLGDIGVQPTAARPTNGLQSISGGASCIIGHPRIEFRTIPAQTHRTPKTIASTGAITIENYTQSAAGKKGEYHHQLGAVVVEIEGKYFYPRHIMIDNKGHFIDLDTEYMPAGTRPSMPALAVALGDVHAQWTNHAMLGETFFSGNSLVKKLKPRNIVWSDTLDFYSQNHHHKHDPFLRLAKNKHGLDIVEQEIKLTFDLVDQCIAAAPFAKHVFPHANHDAALSKWLKECDWKNDLPNAIFYLETALYMARASTIDSEGASIPDPFRFWAKKLLRNFKKCVFLDAGEPYQVLDINLGSHGHLGPNGSRGTILNHSNLGNREVISHSHAPGIMGGCMQVGTSSKLKLGYNVGPSSWLNSHGIVYANGAWTLIHFINDKFYL